MDEGVICLPERYEMLEFFLLFRAKLRISMQPYTQEKEGKQFPF